MRKLLSSIRNTLLGITGILAFGTGLFLSLVTQAGGTGVSAGPVTFSTGEFVDSEWTTRQDPASTGTSTARTEVSGGNPGAYRRVSLTVQPYQSVANYQLWNLAQFTPAAQGEINSVSLSYDLSRVYTSNAGATQVAGGLAVQQDGIIYTHIPGVTTVTPPSWDTVMVADLVPLFPSVDWRNGNTITFGFYDSVSAESIGFTIDGGYDNFQVTVDYTPSLSPTAYSITTDAGTNGTISPSGVAGVVTVNEGQSQTFTFTPNTGYHLVDVLVDGVYVGALSSYTFTNVTANHTIGAAFAKDSPTPTTVFTDGAFDNSDWAVLTFGWGYGGSATLTKSSSGGNPGDYATIVTQCQIGPAYSNSGIDATFRRIGFEYDPKVTGPIKSIDYAEDARGQWQQTGPAIFQNGKVFISSTLSTQLTSWQRLTILNQKQNDFYEITNTSQVVTNGNSHPDFSSNGAPLSFGFIRAISSPTQNYGTVTYVAYIDNWTVTIHTSMLPGATTLEATSITEASAVLNGAVNPSGLATSYQFEYGLTPDYGFITAATSAGSGSADVMINETLSGLMPGATYHYRLIAANNNGTTIGLDQTFTIPGESGLSYITVVPGAYGKISPPGTVGIVQVSSGASQTFDINPDAGYHTDDVMVDGVSVGVQNTYTFPAVTTNHTISATFDLAALDNWHPISPLPQSNQLNALAHGNNTFVAVGNAGTILTSSDGATWTARASETSSSLFNVAYVNDIFLAVGLNGAILTSSDGITWGVKTSGTTETLWGIAYGNNIFVAVGNAGTILSSPDGTTWQTRTSGLSSQLTGIAYGHGTFVAVNVDATMLTSTDGNSWTAKEFGLFKLLRGITYGKHTFVAVGYDGALITSSDGIIRRVRSSGTSNYLVAATHGNNTFAAVGLNGTIITSPDGIIWRGRTTGTSDALYGVACGSNICVAVGQNGIILKSDLLPGPVRPVIYLDRNVWDFGSVLIGSSTARTFTAGNSGDGNLVLGQMTFSEGNNDFLLRDDYCSNRTLMPNGTCTFQVVFQPSSAGSPGTDLFINSNDPDMPALNVGLTGAGAAILPAQPTMTSQPDLLSNSNRAEFAFSSTDSGVAFECRLDGAGFIPCTSPKEYSGLANGVHTFEVRARDEAGYFASSSAGYTWAVQVTYYTVAGLVVDGATGEPLTGVNVAAAGQNAATDGQGQYALGNLMSGSYVIIFNKEGYFPLPVANVVVEQADVALDAALYSLLQYTVAEKAFLAVNQPYNLNFSISGGKSPYAFSIASGQLPSGLALDVASGEVTGTLTNQGVYDFTISVTDESGQEIEKTLHLEIFAPSWPMYRHDTGRTGQSEYSEMSFGDLNWKFQTGGAVLSSPTIAPDGTVYVGSGDTYVYALYHDGTLKWRVKTEDYVASSPTIAPDGTVYVGTYATNGYLYALNPDGSVKWKYQAGAVYSAPTLGSDGSIYVTNNGGALYALNPDGSLKWTSYGYHPTHSPAVGADGTIYMGSEYSLPGTPGYLYAINPANGAHKWSARTDRYPCSSPTVSTDTIYIGGCDNGLYAFNSSNGSRKWKFLLTTGALVSIAPALGSDGTVYVGAGYDTFFYAVNPDGSLKWKFDIGMPGVGNIGTTPSIGADGTIYITNNSGYLYAINPEGTLKWKYQSGFSESSPAIGSDGTIYIGSNDGALYAFHLNQKGVVMGRVLDMSSDVEIAASISTNTGVNAQARINGKYFLLLDPGTYDLTVSLANYQTVVIPDLVIEKGQATDLDLFLPTLGALNITKATLSSSSEGLNYRERIWVAGGTAPYLFSVTNGALPDGLILDAVTGRITGTPVTGGSYTFTIRVTDQQSEYMEKEYTLTVPDTTPPSVTEFSISATADTLTVTITSLTVSNDMDVTGYLVKESVTAPSAADPGWSATRPSSYTFTTAGSKTLYVWVKDASGNISNAVSASVVIIFSDTAAPTVTSFSLPPVSGTLTVSITSLTATDDTAVTGYLLTESATAPGAEYPEWSTAIPSSYTFTSGGVKTLYAWAKDAAGNVSLSMSATVTLISDTLIGIVISAPGNTVIATKSLQLSATGTYDDNHTADITDTVNWLSTDTGIGDFVLPAGTFLGKSAGITTLTASLDGITSNALSMQVEALVARTMELTISPDKNAIMAGSALAFTVLLRDGDGVKLEAQNTAAVVFTVKSGPGTLNTPIIVDGNVRIVFTSAIAGTSVIEASAGLGVSQERTITTIPGIDFVDRNIRKYHIESMLNISLTGGGDIILFTIRREGVAQPVFTQELANTHAISVKLSQSWPNVGDNYAGKYTMEVKDQFDGALPKTQDFMVHLDIVPSTGFFYRGEQILFQAFGTTANDLTWVSAPPIVGPFTPGHPGHPEDTTMKLVEMLNNGYFSVMARSQSNPNVSGSSNALAIVSGGNLQVFVTDQSQTPPVPIQGASIGVQGVSRDYHPVQTGTTGMAYLSRLPLNHDLILTISAPGFTSQSLSQFNGRAIRAVIDPGNPPIVSVAMNPSDLNVSGTVVNMAGLVVSGAVVNISATLGNGSDFATTTNARNDGSFSFGLPGGARMAPGSSLKLAAFASTYSGSEILTQNNVTQDLSNLQLILGPVVISNEDPITNAIGIRLTDLSGLLTPGNTSLELRSGATASGVLSALSAKAGTSFNGLTTPAHLAFTYTPGQADSDGDEIVVRITSASLPGGFLDHSFIIHPTSTKVDTTASSALLDSRLGGSVFLNNADTDGDGIDDTEDTSGVIIPTHANLKDATGQALPSVIKTRIARTEAGEKDLSARYKVEIVDPATGQAISLKKMEISQVPLEERLILHLQMDPEAFNPEKFDKGDQVIMYVDESGQEHINDGTFLVSIDNNTAIVETSHASVWLLATPPPLPGDINGDHAVDLKDAILAMQALTGVVPSEILPDYAASGVDVNGDNRIGLTEVIYILQKVGGLR